MIAYVIAARHFIVRLLADLLGLPALALTSVIDRSGELILRRALELLEERGIGPRRVDAYRNRAVARVPATSV